MRTKEEFDKFYKKKDPWCVSNKYNERNEKINLLIKKYQIGKTLDLGSGEGNFLKYFNKSRLHCNDISTIAIKRLKLKNKNLKCINKDFLKINFNKYDSIFAFETIYYLKKKERILLFKKIKNFLRNKKVFIFSTPIIGKSIHRYYFTDIELKKKFKEFDMKLILEERLNLYNPNKFFFDIYISIILRILIKFFSLLRLERYNFIILNNIPLRFIYQKAYVLKAISSSKNFNQNI